MDFVQKIERLMQQEMIRSWVAELAGHVNDPIRGLIELGLVDIASDISPYDDTRSMCARCLKHIFVDRLPRPPILSEQDLVTPFIESFSFSDDSSLDLGSAISAFCEQLHSLPIAKRRSHPLEAGTGPFIAMHGHDQSVVIEPINVYQSTSGFTIRLLGALPAADDNYGLSRGGLQHTACIQLEAECTPRAIDTAIAESQQVFSSLVKCGVMLSTTRAAQYVSTTEKRGSRREYMVTEGYLISDGELGPWYSFIPDCLNAYFSHPSKKDSMSRRLATAIRLLTQADMQADNGVGLALSIAAVDAMLCGKGGDLTTIFAENVGTLLEPDPRLRADAVRWCKRLYRLRSDVLHGNVLNSHPADLYAARLLGAAVLKAMIERRSFILRADGTAETPADLLMELADDKYTPGQTTGVAESPMVLAWRT